MRLIGKIVPFFDSITRVSAFISAIFLIFIILAVTIGVSMRYLFDSPQAWVIELCEYSLLYIVFLGSAWLLAKDGHISMDLVINRLRPITQAIINTITYFVCMVVSLIIIWYGILVVIDSYQKGLFYYTVLETPTYPILAIVPIGSFLLFIQFMRRTFSYAKMWREAIG
ncbi:TRAP transporter small permease [Chloroflexota bacterium]